MLDRAFDVAAWREVYEQAQGAIKPGRKRNSRKLATNYDPFQPRPLGEERLETVAEQFASSFTQAATSAFGLSRDAVFRGLKIARIMQSVRERISLHAIADNQSELLALSAEPAERQARIAELVVNNAVRSVADAATMIDGTQPVAKPAPWERLSDQFHKMPEAAQRRFIQENWDLIEALIAERKAA